MKPFTSIAVIVFSIISFMHLLRLEGTGKGMRRLSFKKREEIDVDYVASLVRSAIEYNESREKV